MNEHHADRSANRDRRDDESEPRVEHWVIYRTLDGLECAYKWGEKRPPMPYIKRCVLDRLKVYDILSENQPLMYCPVTYRHYEFRTTRESRYQNSVHYVYDELREDKSHD